MLARLQALSDDHFNAHPDEVNWGHVGTLEHYASLLKRITDSAFRKASTRTERSQSHGNLTIRIAIRGLNEPWDTSRIPAVLDEIEASLREEADIPARLTADSMTIAIDVATDRLPDAAALLRDLGLI